MKKIFKQKNLNFLFGHLWIVELTYSIYKFLPSSSLQDVCSLILFPLFATVVVDTGGKFAAGVVDTGGNLPLASLTPVANLPLVSLTPVANLPLVPLTPVANLPPVSTTLAKLGENFASSVVDTSGAP
jgi:hypothetical protein